MRSLVAALVAILVLLIVVFRLVLDRSDDLPKVEGVVAQALTSRARRPVEPLELPGPPPSSPTRTRPDEAPWKVEAQPLAAQVRRLVEALDLQGEPLSSSTRSRLDEALGKADPADRARSIQEVLDPLCLFAVTINPDGRVGVARGARLASLGQHEWRIFPVKVQNEAGVTCELSVASPNAEPVFRISNNSARPKPGVTLADVADRWMDLSWVTSRPMTARLSGLRVEYRLIQLYSRDAGPREARLRFDNGELDILFRCEPAVPVTLNVLDADGRPTTASFVFRDVRGRTYPSASRRLAPDFWFQPQVYRHTGESIELPPGRYTVEVGRGPEYEVQTRTIDVPRAATHCVSFALKRWINLARLGWFSGDHHIHAAGCGHYERPTEGVRPVDMMRHVLGEDLHVGCVLSWGPCWYAQKANFKAKDDELSTSGTLMRYDVEVSGFPSSSNGHLVLLRLKEDDYPGTSEIEHWPSWNLPIARWAKSQGAVVGYAHTGYGLKTLDNALPSLDVPPFDAFGAMEYLVDVAHDAVDFLSTIDSPAPWELNLWYHALNCGFRTRIGGETDFPCLFGERVGVGRTYVRPADGVLDFDRWVEGLKDGRSYVSDGKSHLVDFALDDVRVGNRGSERKLQAPGVVTVSARVAALLEPVASPSSEAIKRSPLDSKPYWDVERARIGDSRTVPVEVIVNGKAVGLVPIEADGALHEISLPVRIERSSWVALRIYPSSHTNPIFVIVAGRPIRASKASADWCLKAIDQCWSRKSPGIRDEERAEAQKAYDIARVAYRKILDESTDY
jgi:hypothetical protein